MISKKEFDELRVGDKIIVNHTMVIVTRIGVLDGKMIEIATPTHYFVRMEDIESIVEKRMTEERFEFLKPGDKVRIVDEKGYSCWNPEGKMDEYLGKIMTVKKVNPNDTYGPAYAKMEEDEGIWFWYLDMIDALIVETKQETKENTNSVQITIDVDGNRKTVTASMAGIKGVAKCHPNNEFDFRIGINLALKRLYEKVERRKCDERDSHYTRTFLCGEYRLECGSDYSRLESSEKELSKLIKLFDGKITIKDNNMYGFIVERAANEGEYIIVKEDLKLYKVETIVDDRAICFIPSEESSRRYVQTRYIFDSKDYIVLSGFDPKNFL